MRASSVAVALMVVAVASAAACGGGGGGDRLTQEEYIAQADAICKDASDRIDALAEPQTKEETIEYLQEGRAIGEDQLASLRELSPPESIEARVEEAYGLIEDQLALTEDLEQAVEDEDVARIDELVAEGEAIDQQANAIAQEIGLQECGSS